MLCYAKRHCAANQKKRVQRANGSLAQVWGRAAPNGLPAESMARPIRLRKDAQAPRTRTNTTPPQREESPERRQCRFHIRLFGAVWGGRSAASTFSPSVSPRGKHSKADVLTQKRSHAAPPTPFPASLRPFVLRRDRRKETHKPEVNQTSSITAQSHENALRRSRPTRNRNERFRKPSCLALCVKQQA